MIKECINEMKGKEIFDDVIANVLGPGVVGAWTKSGYCSTKNIITVLAKDGEGLVMHGSATYVLGTPISIKYPMLAKKKVCARKLPLKQRRESSRVQASLQHTGILFEWL